MADLLVGQGDWSAASGNRVDAMGLAEPWSMAVDTSTTPPRLWVADKLNHRVLGFADATEALSTDGGLPAATWVLGNTDLDQPSVVCPTPSATSLCEPSGVAVDALGVLYVADTRNNRVLAFDAPTVTRAAARVFGQPSLVVSRCAPTPDDSSLCSPRAVAVDDGRRLYVADQLNNRVLRYDTPSVNARANGLFGQARFTTTTANFVDGAGLRAPFAVAYDAARDVLFVADTGNSRVLVWTSAAAFTSGQPASRVIGQADFFDTGCNQGGRTDARLCFPTGLLVDAAGTLYVADSGNNRVLLFDLAASTGDAVADAVVGQSDFTSGDCAGTVTAANVCLSPSAVSLSSSSTPRVGLALFGNRLAISDTGRHRVLVFDSPRPAVGAAAGLVLGQSSGSGDLPNAGGLVNATSLYQPAGLFFESQDVLWVADRLNNRVLRYSLVGTPAPTLVLGQVNLTTGTCRSGLANGLCGPNDVAVFESTLLVADSRASRVVGYPMASLADGMNLSVNLASTSGLSFAVARPATNALLFLAEVARNRVARFQPATTFATGNTSVAWLGQRLSTETRADLLDEKGLSRPGGLAVAGSGAAVQLWVADTGNNRVVRFPNALAAPGPAADKVLGQTSLLLAACSSVAGGLCSPEAVAVSDSNQVVAGDNSRAFVFSVAGTSGTVLRQIGGSFNGPVPDAGLGDPHAGQFNGLKALAWYGRSLFAADSRDHRVLRFDDASAPFPLATGRFGQGAWGAVNRNGATNAGLYLPTALAIAPGPGAPRLWVADTANHRVLGWRSIDAQQLGQPADIVLGQPDHYSTLVGAPSATSLSSVFGLAVDAAGTLYVSDRAFHRVLLFNDPFTDATPLVADAVVGQPGFSSVTANRGSTPNAGGFAEPLGIAVDPQGRLYVADSANNRVLVFNPPLTNTSVATLVLGQPDFTSRVDPGDQPAEDTLRMPTAVAVDGQGDLWVADGRSQRVVGYTSPFTTDTVGDVCLGQPSLQTRTPASSWCYFDEYGADATGSCPLGLAVDRDLTVYVTDAARSRVSVFEAPLSPQGDQEVDATFGSPNPVGCGSLYERDQPNSATQQSMCLAWGLAVDGDNALWVSDALNHRVLRYLDNAPPRASMPTITPTAPRRGLSLVASYTFQDLDGQPEGASRITWWVDGVSRPALSGQRQVDGLQLRRGEQWTFEVEPYDGLQYGPRAAASPVVVLNAPPEVVVAARFEGLLGAPLVLDASASSDLDGDPVSFSWTQVSGPTLVLNDASAAAPVVTAAEPGRMLFRLVATDGLDPSPARDVEVIATTHGADNQAPLAVAFGPAKAELGTVVALDGTASSDPDPLDGPYLRYRWELVAFPTGATPVLVNGRTAQPFFTARTEGDFTARLVVDDGSLQSAPAFVTVRVGRAATGCGCSTSAPGAGWGLVVLAALVWRRRPRAGALVLAALVAFPSLGAPRLKKTPAPAADPRPADETHAAATPRSEAGPPNPYLEEARRLYLEFQYEQVLPQLEFALAVKGVSPAQRLDIFKLKAVLHIALDEPAAADATFGRLLDLDPDYAPDGASPKVRERFKVAYAAWETARAVSVEHTPPKGTGDVHTTIDVLVARGQDRIGAMNVHYRLKTQTPAPYSQSTLRRGDGGRAWSAPVPVLFPGPAARRTVEYFVRVRGPAGELLTQLGDEGRPLVMEVETVAQVVPVPAYASPWLWSGVALGLAAAVVVPLVVVHREIPVQSGSLGKDRLP